MILSRDWLWDRKTSIRQIRIILQNPQNKNFFRWASLLLSRENLPKEVFRHYLKPRDLVINWNRIKRQMRKNAWNDPRIEYWQAIYEKLKEKYNKKGIKIVFESKIAKPRDPFCKSVADKLTELRKQKGLTQAKLARKLRISQQMISRIEKGRENISLLTLKNIANSIGAEIHLEISPKGRRWIS